MNPSLSIPQISRAMPPGLGTVNVSSMLALPGFKSRQATTVVSSPVNTEYSTDNVLPVNAEELIDNVLGMLNTFVVKAIEARTPTEFIATRDRVFPQYFDAVLGLSYLIQIVVPKDVLEVMSNESFSKIEASFRDRGLAAFGLDVRDQAVFTTWTLKKISDLCNRIDTMPLSSELEENNRDLFNEFLVHTMCTRFSLDCLSKSMLLQKPIYPDVLPIVIDGLRNAVNTYAYSRRALALREAVPEPPLICAEWDDEDQQLLDEASYDLLEMTA